MRKCICRHRANAEGSRRQSTPRNGYAHISLSYTKNSKEHRLQLIDFLGIPKNALGQQLRIDFNVDILNEQVIFQTK